MPNQSYCTAHNNRAGCRVYSPGHLSILTVLCYTNQQLLAFSTYVHGEAQTPTGFICCCHVLQINLLKMYNMMSLYRCECNRGPAMLNAVKYGRPAMAQFFKVHNCACKNGSCEPYPTSTGNYLSSIC